MTTFKWLTEADLSAQETLEESVRQCYAGKIEENYIAYLSAEEKRALINSITDGIGSLWDGDKLVAQVAVQQCSLNDKVRARFITLGREQDDAEGYMMRNGMVAPGVVGKGLMVKLFGEVISRVDSDEMPMAFTALTTNTPILRIGHKYGFEEVTPLRRIKDGADMVLLLRPAMQLAKQAVA